MHGQNRKNSSLLQVALSKVNKIWNVSAGLNMNMATILCDNFLSPTAELLLQISDNQHDGETAQYWEFVLIRAWQMELTFVWPPPSFYMVSPIHVPTICSISAYIELQSKLCWSIVSLIIKTFSIRQRSYYAAVRCIDLSY